MNWAVIYCIHTSQPETYIPKLFVTDVPDTATAKELQRQLNKAGYLFTESGIAWANHYVANEEEWPADLLEGKGDTEEISWAVLSKKTQKIKRVVVRLTPEQHARITAAADRAGVSLQMWCVQALEAALLNC